MGTVLSGLCRLNQPPSRSVFMHRWTDDPTYTRSNWSLANMSFVSICLCLVFLHSYLPVFYLTLPLNHHFLTVDWKRRHFSFFPSAPPLILYQFSGGAGVPHHNPSVAKAGSAIDQSVPKAPRGRAPEGDQACRVNRWGQMKWIGRIYRGEARLEIS